jgi:V/A-type H+-transporting ATPase subunit D
LEGYELLEQKREILVMELMQKVGEVKRLERELEQKTDAAYPVLKRMLVRLGRREALAISGNAANDFNVREKTVVSVGIALPVLEVVIPEAKLSYSLTNSRSECDEVVLQFRELLKFLTELSSLRTLAWRLAREVRKVQRRVNALEKMVIPAARDTKVYIESALEEKDRDFFFSTKLLKRKKEKELTDAS